MDNAFASGAPKGFIVIELEVFDPAKFEDYRAAVAPMIAAAGGRYIVRGGEVRKFEGYAPQGRVVLLEFPSLAMAENFLHSEEYQPVAALRHNSAKSRIYLVEGTAA